MAGTPANYVFLPWVRQGAACDIQTVDQSADQAGFVSVKVKLRVNNSAADEIEQQVRLYGPGDVIGIDARQVLRTVPTHLSADFEPNYFPAIEFDRPDFPWLFTPAKADAGNRLRPWLCLVVIRKQRGVTLSRDRVNPLPVLEIKTPANADLELPDLSESWAWAHAQIAGVKRDFDSLKKSLAGDPALTVSRLLCPRRLDPLTDYLACVVPAFELGVKAGLGIPIQHDDKRDEEQSLEPAWKTGATSEIRLPVYFDWEFRTGTGGDFEALVGMLTARALDSSVGKRLVDISHAFADQPPAASGKGMTLELQGALRVAGSPPAEWIKDTREPFQSALQAILNLPWQQATTAQPDKDEDPILAPPIYGCWQAARHLVNIKPTPAQPLNWLDELNLDPRHRGAAAIGTQVVQVEQEQLMASAWEQLGDLTAINQIRRQAQLGRAVNVVYHNKHFSRFSEETLLKVMAPAQSRVVVGSLTSGDKRALLSQKIVQSGIPVQASSAPLRRFTSTRGVVNTRFKPAVARPIAIMSLIKTQAQVAVSGSGMVTMNRVSNAMAGRPDLDLLKQSLQIERASSVAGTAPQLGNFKIAAEGTLPNRTVLDFPKGQPDSPDASMFRKLVKAQQDFLGQLFAPAKANSQLTFNLFTTDIKGRLLQSVDPEKTILARVQAADSTTPPGDQLEPILDAPEFPQPMYEALRDLAQDFLFSGLQKVPVNTVTVLETNPPFVESFMVGLNSEMSHELLWRNYPTDQRGTYFRQFWDTSVDKPEADMKEIRTWGNTHLGQNLTRGSSGNLVLLIRGELLRRYPNSVIYAVKAVKTGGKLGLSTNANDESLPIFRGTMKPDVTFLGFNLTEAAALGLDPAQPNGWFFVIQEQPTEPRFGMDVADFVKPPQPPPLQTWDDLSWRHLANTEVELNAMTHASVKIVLPSLPKATWGINSNSAHHAYITLQRPVRIAIHAKQMIKRSP